MSDGRNDVLTVATGKPDHPGRVRGIGGRVGIKQYFGTSKRHKKSMVTREEMEQTMAKQNEEAEAKAAAKLAAQEASLTAMFESRMSQLQEQVNQMKLLMSSRPETSVPCTPAPVQPSTKGSCIDGQSTLPQAPSPPRQAPSPPRQAPSSPPSQASSPPRQSPSPPRQASSPPRQAPPPRHPPSRPTAKLTARETISDMMKSGYFKDRSWPVNEVVGLDHMLPVYVDTVDVTSLLVPRQELTSPIVQIFMK